MSRAIEAAARSLCRSGCEDLKTIGTFKCEDDGHCIYWEKYVPDAEAAIAAYHEAGGTVAVPVEPTYEMIDAGSKATLLLSPSDVAATYKAMLAARPEGDG